MHNKESSEELGGKFRMMITIKIFRSIKNSFHSLSRNKFDIIHPRGGRKVFESAHEHVDRHKHLHRYIYAAYFLPPFGQKQRVVNVTHTHAKAFK